MINPDVARCTQCLTLLQDLGVTLSMDEVEDKLCRICNGGVLEFDRQVSETDEK